MVPGVTSRCTRSRAGRSRISAARMARSAQSSRGRGLARRSTATSCRNTSSSASLDADVREQSQPAAEPDEDEVEQAQGHKPAMLPAARPLPQANPQVSHLRSVWNPTGKRVVVAQVLTVPDCWTLLQPDAELRLMIQQESTRSTAVTTLSAPTGGGERRGDHLSAEWAATACPLGRRTSLTPAGRYPPVRPGRAGLSGAAGRTAGPPGAACRQTVSRKRYRRRLR